MSSQFIMERKPFHLFLFIVLLSLLNPCFLSFSDASPLNLDLSKLQVGTKTEGVSQLKKYLSSLGYMSNGADTDDTFDEDLQLAIKKFQQLFNLTVSGTVDAPTLAKLEEPRCGSPDFMQVNESQIPLIASTYTFFPGKLKWPPGKRTLTYSFPKGTTWPDIYKAIQAATQQWASVSKFRFVYIPDYNKADVKISFQVRDHGDGNPFDGRGQVLAHAFAPTDGRLHFDGDEKWVYGVRRDAADLQTVGLHELGHILGLGHSTDVRAVMYPYISYGQRKGLGQDDINGIRVLYNS